MDSLIPWMEHRVTIACPLQLAWNTFLQFNKWAPRRGLSSGLSWPEGRAWLAGSRFALEMLAPQKVRVTGKITGVEAPRRLTWISHGNGVTTVHFLDLLELGPERTLLEAGSQLTGTPLLPCEPTRDENHFHAYAHVYDQFRAECEDRAGMQP